MCIVPNFLGWQLCVSDHCQQGAQRCAISHQRGVIGLGALGYVHRNHSATPHIDAGRSDGLTYGTRNSSTQRRTKVLDLFAREPHRTPCDMRSRDQMSFPANASICTIVLILRRRRPSILILTKILRQPPQSATRLYGKGRGQVPGNKKNWRGRGACEGRRIRAREGVEFFSFWATQVESFQLQPMQAD